jgi:hypothetical protein
MFLFKLSINLFRTVITDSLLPNNTITFTKINSNTNTDETKNKALTKTISFKL